MFEFKKVILLITHLTVLMVFLLYSSCKPGVDRRDKLLIVTTIYPYEMIVRELVAGSADVRSIIPPSVSPHTYSPKPEDAKILEDAGLIISNGAELEAYLDDILFALSDKHIDAFSLISDFIHFDGEYDNVGIHLSEHSEDKLESNHHHHHHHHHINPHFWLDPILVVRIASGICDALIVLDSDNEDKYRENLQKLTDNLNNLSDSIIAERENMLQQEGDQMPKSIQPTVLNFHDAFHYFNQRFSVFSAGVIVRSPGKEPTPAELVKLGRQIETLNVTAILIEPQLNPKAAEIIAKQFDLQLLTVDPIGTEKTVSTITELIDYNWQVIKQALSPEW